MNPPTELELMMYFDGELEEPRASEVRQALAVDARAGAKLRGLSVLGKGMQVHRSQQVFPDVVASVMSSIELPAAPVNRPLVVGETRGHLRAVPSDRSDRRIESSALRTPATSVGVPRWVLGAVGAAAAAAATWFSVSSDRKVERTERAEVAVQSTSESRPGPIEPPSSSGPDDTFSLGLNGLVEEAPSVEIASVDFGSRTGAIYYMPGLTAGATTTVVWLSEE